MACISKRQSIILTISGSILDGHTIKHCNEIQFEMQMIAFKKMF